MSENTIYDFSSRDCWNYFQEFWITPLLRVTAHKWLLHINRQSCSIAIFFFSYVVKMIELPNICCWITRNKILSPNLVLERLISKSKKFRKIDVISCLSTLLNCYFSNLILRCKVILDHEASTRRSKEWLFCCCSSFLFF